MPNSAKPRTQVVQAVGVVQVSHMLGQGRQVLFIIPKPRLQDVHIVIEEQASQVFGQAKQEKPTSVNPWTQLVQAVGVVQVTH